MKKKVVLVDLFYLLAAITGIKTYTVELWQGLSGIDKEGYEFKAIPDLNTVLRIKTFRERPSLINRLAYHFLYFAWKQLVLPLIARVNKADVVISPDFVSPAWKLKALKVSVVHDALFWKYPANYNKYWRQYYLKMLGKGLRGKSLIVTTSKYSKQSIGPFIPSHIPIEVVYQNLSQNLLNNAEMSTHSVLFSLGLEPKKYLLHAGFFDKRKNLPKLVEAYDLFLKLSGSRDMKLVLAGETGPHVPGSVYRQVKDAASSLGIDHLVILPGYVSSNDLKQLYANAFLYVFPSIDEGFGIPILEAMAHNLPVLVSNAGSLPEIGGDAVAFFDPLDGEDIAKTLHEVYQFPLYRAELITRGAQRLKHFSREQFAQQMADAIERHLA